MDKIKSIATEEFIDVQVEKDCGCRGQVKAVQHSHGEIEIHQCNLHSWDGHSCAFALAFVGLGALCASLVWLLLELRYS